MNNVVQRSMANGLRPHQRASADHRGNVGSAFGTGDGSRPMPAGPPPPLANGGIRHRATVSGPVFDGPRSPPNTKSTWFYLSLQGECLVLMRCLLRHFTRSLQILPIRAMSSRQGLPFLPLDGYIDCRYTMQILFEGREVVEIPHEVSRRSYVLIVFQGNCKFGAKCALAHVLPNGRRVNRPNGTHLNLGGRVDPQTSRYLHQDSALASSLLAQQANGNAGPLEHQFSQLSETDFIPQGGLPRTHDIPSFDTAYASQPGSNYGSPREDTRLPLSPVAHLSALDAPMPASFDSQGISYMARHGPVAASVPSKFGLESPPSSLPKKAMIPSDSVRNVPESVYNKETRSRVPNMGSSPLGSGDEGYGQRIMHSQRVAKPKMMSASLPRGRANDEWDDQFMFGGEEDFLPNSLHELLTPQEKMRRMSRTEPESSSHREQSSGIGTPAESSSKFGSPANASPSRYGALFARHKRDEENNNHSHASAFGHVGSPLRNSSLHPGSSPGLRAISNPTLSGDTSPHLASPPRQSSMSALSQQLSHTRLASRNEHAGTTELPKGLHPSSARHWAQPNGRSDRNFSPSSFGTNRIDEEQAEGVFSMEEEEEHNSKRFSGGWHSVSLGGRPSPRLGPIGGGR